MNDIALLAPPIPDRADDPGFQFVEHGLPDWLARLLRLPLQGRVTPDAPALQGRPKPAPPRARPLQPEHPVGHGPFKCRYCGRYGQPGACDGCGAPNAPAIADAPLPPQRPDIIMRAVSAGVITPNEARRYMDVSTFGKPGQLLVIPEFDMVKR